MRLTISDGNTVDLSALAGGGGGSGLALTASDEGSVLSKNVRTLDFVGNVVTATNSGNAVTVTINTASLPDGLVSGSSQVSYNNISDVPNNILSSSAQIASDISGSLSATAIAGLGAGIISSSDQILPIATSIITNFDTEVSRSVAEAGFGSGNTQVFSAGLDIIINSGSGTVEISGSEFNGNRVVSNQDLPSGIRNVNFGTSGSLSNFIEKVFFPNSVPVINQHGFTIQEFEVSGSSVGTLSATDAKDNHLHSEPPVHTQTISLDCLRCTLH